MDHFEDVIVPVFGWVVFVIFVFAIAVWGARILKFFIANRDEPPYPGETLGLPKGSVRSFIVITFSAVMFLIFFGDFDAVPAEDRKWFLTAYSSVLAFYFGAKYFPERFVRRGLGIFSILPPVGKRPPKDKSKANLKIGGIGFDAPKSVTFTQGNEKLTTSPLSVTSQEALTVAVELEPKTTPGAYDVTVELDNGSKVVSKAGFTVE